MLQYVLPSQFRFQARRSNPQVRIQRINPRLHNLLILRWRPSTRSNTANNLLLRIENRQAASKSRESSSVAVPQAIRDSAGPDSFLVRVRSDSVARRGEGFVQCD